MTFAHAFDPLRCPEGERRARPVSESCGVDDAPHISFNILPHAPGYHVRVVRAVVGVIRLVATALTKTILPSPMIADPKCDVLVKEVRYFEAITSRRGDRLPWCAWLS